MKKYGIYSTRADSKNLLYFDRDKVEYYDWPDDLVFVASKHEYKIAVLEIQYGSMEESKIQIEQFKHCDRVIIYSMELELAIVELIKQYDLPNFIFIVNGILNERLKHAHYIVNTPWLSSGAQYWLDMLLDDTLTKLRPFDPKPYQFEVMYGKVREHRTYVSDWIASNNLASHIYQTPYFTQQTDQVNSIYPLERKDLWEDEIVPSTTENHYCTYRGVKMRLSQVVPFKIYQQAAFSVVCETSHENTHSFFTEKLAKPLIGCRMFVVISGQYYLKNLKSLGFKTFDSIIDESYDNEPDNEKRWNMAMEQVKFLCQQDQKEILKAVVPIVLHNRDLLSRLPVEQVRNTVEALLFDKELESL